MSKTLEKVGEVTHYFTKIGVAVVDLSSSLKIGDNIAIKGSTTNFEMKITSMQIDGENLEAANEGDDIGLKVVDRVRASDFVYRITEK